MPSLKGADKAIRRLRKLNSAAAEKRVGAAIFAAAKTLAVDAQISITEGSAGGASGGKHQHIPSLPGEPPHNFTGHLADNIEAVQTSDALASEVSSNAQYSAALEFGSSRMAARPFMKPAAERIRPKARAFVAEAISREIRRG